VRKTPFLILALVLALPGCARQAVPTQPAAAPQIQTAVPASSGQDLPPRHPATADQARELIDLSGMANMQKQMFSGMMPTLRRSAPPYMPEDVLDDFEKTLGNDYWQPAVIQAYQAHFSTEDAAAAIAFYKSPAGRHIVAESPIIFRDLQLAGAQLGTKVMQEVLERHKAEIEAAKKKYEMTHPQTAPNN